MLERLASDLMDVECMYAGVAMVSEVSFFVFLC